MKSMLNKDLFMDIKKSTGRYLSILCIVALGVAFYSGIKVSPIVMETTADKYYDDYNMMDVRVVSTLGLTDDDVKEIKKINSVDGVFPTYSMDVINKDGSQEQVYKIHALPLEDIKNNDKNYINRVNVVKGRLPQKSGECVIERDKIRNVDSALGKTIKLSSGTDKSLSETLKHTEYKVVGIIETPYYISYEKGSSSIGNGSVEGVIMVPQDDIKMDAYTEIFLTLDSTKSENSFSDKYFDKVDLVTKKIDNLSKERIKARYNEVVTEANEEYEKGKKEFEDKESEVNEELSKAENEINKYNRQIKDGEAKLLSNKNKVNEQIYKGKQALADGEKKLKDGYEKYDQGSKLFNENKVIAQQQIIEAEDKLQNTKTQIDNLSSYVASLEQQLNNENISDEEKKNITTKINENKQILSTITPIYNQGKDELNTKKQQLQETENQLALTKKTLDQNKINLEKEKQKLILNEAKAKQEFAKAGEEIKKQKNKIKDAEVELEDSKIKAKDELSKAEKKIKDAKDEIDKIEMPEWYVLDRNSHYSYVEYKSSAEGIDKVSNVFPVFFFCVAALVCLTTMTRMVDEQRINIGTLKALGYTTGQIAKKYILYALSASFLGSVLGIIIGCIIFPTIIFNAYGIMYTLPPMKLIFDIKISAVVTIISVSITTLATYFACYNELRETPSVLMRPKSPKLGKRILLEKIPFIWNKVGFIGKVTIRNIFRYKKRFFMTVLGIAGCSALILVGLGIQDSIQMIVDGQFGNIIKYDMSVSIDNNIKPSEFETIEKYLSLDKNIEDFELTRNENGKISVNGKQKDVTIVVPKDSKQMKKFINLKNRKNKKDIELGKEGIVLSEKIATQLNIKVGDEIQLINGNDKKTNAKVLGITENYISNYAYISKEYYKEIFNRDAEYNNANAIVKDKSKSVENEVAKELMKKKGVTSVGFNTEIKQNFKNTIKSLNYVVLVMTLSAGMLAFVVLYNLTNVNISERIREIATIKVLGFYDNEVSAYIYRENIILTTIGALVGLGMGKVLHLFIMTTLEPDSIMFGRIIQNRSFFIAFILTIILGLIVNFAMYYKLKRVKMVESLKSVD